MPTHFDQWRDAAAHSPIQSVALLTGLPRSGTTLLAGISNAHSQVVTGDEWDAFPRLIFPTMLGPTSLEQADITWLDALSESHLARKRNAYFRFLSAALNESLSGKTLIDKNPSLLPLVPVYKRLLPLSHVIIALRDPRDVLLSCMLTYFPLNDFSIDFLSLDTAAERIVHDLKSWLTLRDRIAEGWVEVKYEDLVRDWPSTVTEVLKEMKLPWQDGLRDYREGAITSLTHSPSYDAVRRPIYTDSVGRWQHYASHLEPVLPQFGPLMAALGYES